MSFSLFREYFNILYSQGQPREGGSSSAPPPQYITWNDVQCTSSSSSSVSKSASVSSDPDSTL